MFQCVLFTWSKKITTGYVSSSTYVVTGTLFEITVLNGTFPCRWRGTVKEKVRVGFY